MWLATAPEFTLSSWFAPFRSQIIPPVSSAVVLLSFVFALACGRGEPGQLVETVWRDSASVRIVENAGPVWGDGNDIADWSPEQMEDAVTIGRVSSSVLASTLLPDSGYRDNTVSAAAIEVLVEETP